MKTGKKLSSAILTLLFVCVLALVNTAAAGAEEASTDVNRFNVVLVVDKSGSLCEDNGGGTDPHGLRFDALRLFLGLLTESGNRVGAIVFDEQIRYDSGLQPMESIEDKLALIRAVESFGTSYDTDIGGAVLRATELLEGMREENGLSCMILLFSDGKTDFSPSHAYPWAMRQRSWEKGRQALERAREAGITINGILLNVNGSAEGGDFEFKLYTEGTKGTFEEITSAEDLTAAFRRFYAIINNTVYTGSEKIAFSDAGEAETTFTVPSFGVEEVNVVLEHKADGNAPSLDERMSIEITRPNGSVYEITEREIVSSRYILVKIPHPELGRWHVRLRGEPSDTVDITMVFNASMSVLLSSDNPDVAFSAYTPYRVSAVVRDPVVAELSEEVLGQLNAVLELRYAQTGGQQLIPMHVEGDEYVCDLTLTQGGDFTASALVGMDGFEVRSNTLEGSVEVPPLAARVDSVTDMFSIGRFLDDHWEVGLVELFGVGEGDGIEYILSDKYGGALSIQNGTLQARFHGEEAASFTLCAKNALGQSAVIPFDFWIPAVSAHFNRVQDMLWNGTFRDDCWEISLEELFSDDKGTALQYELSDDYGGALTLEDGMLRARFRDTDTASFTLSATDIFENRAEVPFDLTIPVVTAKTKKVTDMLKNGSFNGNIWESDLAKLFEDPKQLPLDFALSDDFNGALALEDGRLRMDISRLKTADFIVTATDIFGVKADLPFTLRLPEPNVLSSPIAETVKTGVFQEGTWQRRLDGLFKDPKGSGLRYSLSDDFGGALRLEDGYVRANCKGLKEASFRIIAVDAFDLQAELPVTLTERNMTLVYGLWALAGLLGVGLIAGLVIYLRRR